jgi:purine nucleoside phosphorylase
MVFRLKIGIIGGTGLDNPDILANRTEKFVETPFGKVFLHRFLPLLLNDR